MANATSAFPADGLDVQANLTLVETISQWPAAAWENRDFLLLEARIVGTALACIYMGAHGALRRPPSAKPSKKAKKGLSSKDEEQEADDQYVQGLLPSDAIMFPILAGMVLVGLYYLIKWLEDPAILNKILGLYFSLMSLASMGKLLADALHLLTSVVFPDTWRASGGTLYHFDAARQSQYRMTDSGERVYDENKTSPFPMQALSQLKVSKRTRTALWETRHVLREEWTVGLTVHGLVKERFQVQLNDIFGLVLALGANIAYQTTGSVFLSNLMGYAFSYTGIIMMSPTTFTTGSAVLFGLFFYDIYMVFYTPYMVTVATKLDVPIKLVFQGPQKASMLGLGDIVVPGMFIGICLRFDHFLHYYRQRKFVPVELKKEDETSGELVTTTETRRMAVRPEYISPQGQWANRFWSTPLVKMWCPDATPALTASAFRKPYFHASMFGYLLGMMVTLMMLLVFKHAQPALLYLVPGVVFSVWVTGALRGELHEMWIYTEDGSLDKEDVLVEVDGNGNVVRELEDAATKKDKEEKQEKTGAGKDQDEKSPKSSAKKPKNRTVVSFTIEAPTSLTVKED